MPLVSTVTSLRREHVSFQANASGHTRFPRVPPSVVRTLRRLRAQIVQIDAAQLVAPPMMWRFLVMDDSGVEYFIVRDADSRWRH